MNKIILVLTVSLFVVSTYAQNSTQNEYFEWKPSQNEYENFDIGKYITPDIVRNLLDINVDFRSNNSYFDDSYSNRDVENKRSNFTGYISSYFSRYVNTRKKISNLAGNLSFNENYNATKNKQTFTDNSTIIDKTSSSLQQNSLFLNWSNKWYFSKLIFMDYGMNSDISYNFTQNKSEYQLDDSNHKQKEFSLQISPQLGIGYGRKEDVQDARHAVYIANSLSKKNVLTRNLSNDELTELSRIISTVKNKRFLDARLHLLEEITTINAFLDNNDLLADNGAAYFSTLYDMWLYGGMFSRQSGYEISFLVRPDYIYQNKKFTPEIRDMILNLNKHVMSLTFSYEKPFKLNWQHSVVTDVSGGIGSSSNQNKQTGNDYKNTAKFNAISALANYALGYYPNTRTFIQVTTSQQIWKDRYDDDRRSTNFRSILGANLNYYFSPHLRLTGDCNLTYSPSRLKGYEDYHSYRFNYFISTFSIRLTYSIF
jgi:hypothetical protein